MTRIWIGLSAILVTLSGCSKDVQKTQPQTKSQRGETCRARNDCVAGLACVFGTCSQNDFDIDVSAGHCDRVDCEVDTDCCGDKPLEAPARCSARASVCETPMIEGCVNTGCTEDDDCEGGVCGAGSCAVTFAYCDADTPCDANTCDTVNGYCTLSFVSCTNDANCNENSCAARLCDCQNPDYDPFDEICSDEECTDVCIYTCEEQRCVQDTSCENDDDCAMLDADICDGGRCVECIDNDDCEGEDDECLDGFCDQPCAEDEECPLFHECQDGECEEVGCKTDRECVLAANSGDPTATGEPRRAQCLATDENPDIKHCRVPCENDAECVDMLHDTAQGAVDPHFQVCDTDGFCKFIGCTSDEECRAYLGLNHQEPTDDRPFVTTAVCSEE